MSMKLRAPLATVNAGSSRLPMPASTKATITTEAPVKRKAEEQAESEDLKRKQTLAVAKTVA